MKNPHWKISFRWVAIARGSSCLSPWYIDWPLSPCISFFSLYCLFSSLLYYCFFSHDCAFYLSPLYFFLFLSTVYLSSFSGISFFFLFTPFLILLSIYCSCIFVYLIFDIGVWTLRDYVLFQSWVLCFINTGRTLTSGQHSIWMQMVSGNQAKHSSSSSLSTSSSAS